MTPIPLETCPTCEAKHLEGEWVGERHYRFRGQEFGCNCQLQYELRKRYLLANIPSQYQHLDFSEYRYSGVRHAVENYLTGWRHAAKLGMGMMFWSQGVGTGKTFAATHVGKTLIKHKQNVYFVGFEQLINNRDVSDECVVASYLIIDEVRKPYTERSGVVFADNFERVIRHRNHYALPTILTTNLTPEELAELYPRTASLLMPTTVEIPMPGDSYRTNAYAMENLELFANKETRPLS